MNKKRVIAYTDGSAIRGGGTGNEPGGFAVVLIAPHRRIERYGWASAATVNQMELGAILVALQLIKPVGYGVHIKTDSKYCVGCLTKWHVGWRWYGWTTSVGQSVKNREIIEAILERMGEHKAAGGEVMIKYVPGHRGIAENERADLLAGRARVERICNIDKPIAIPGLDVHEHQVRRRVLA